MLYLPLKTKPFSVYARFLFVASVRGNLTKVFALNSLQQQVIAVNNWKENILVNFVNTAGNCILKSGAHVFYSELVDLRPRDVLHNKIVRVAAGQNDIKKNRQRTWHNGLILFSFGKKT